MKTQPITLPTKARLVSDDDAARLQERQAAVQRDYRPQCGFLLDARYQRLPSYRRGRK